MSDADEDNLENYRKYLASLMSRTRSRGYGRYYNKFASRCRAEAAAKYPKGAAADSKKFAGWFGLAALLDLIFNLGG